MSRKALPFTHSTVLRQWWRDGDWERLMPYIEESASNTLVRFGLDADEVEDVVQTTLIKCWRLGAEAPEHPMGFASRVARNVCLDRKKRDKWYDHSGDNKEQDMADPTMDVLSMMSQEDSKAELKAALKVLPDMLRRPVVLRYLHGHEYSHIEGILGLKPAAIRMRVARGIQALRRIMLEQDKAEEVPDIRHNQIPLGSSTSVFECFSRHLDIGTQNPFPCRVIIHP